MSTMQNIDIIKKNLKKRHQKEKIFKRLGFSGLLLATIILFTILGSIFSLGKEGFFAHYVKIPIYFDKDILDPKKDMSKESLFEGDYGKVIKSSLRAYFPDVKKRKDKKQLYYLVSPNAFFDLRNIVLENPDFIGKKKDVWLLASDKVDLYKKNIVKAGPDSSVSKKLEQHIVTLDSQKRVKEEFYTAFFFNGDSRNPESAGIIGGIIGTFWLMVVTFFLSFPLGIATAVYVEEFADRNQSSKLKRKLLDILEVNINSLASVPSVVFGILGLGVFINFFGMPRSAPITGGFVLALMTLPVIIITTRTALQSIPLSIREAALAIGANKFQLVLHHLIPLALPGILTGSIIGLSRAIGETAPLLMIGMVAFIIGAPDSMLQPSTALPVQIYLWADSAEEAFIYKTSAAIIALLAFMIMMNLSAIIIRQKFSKKW